MTKLKGLLPVFLNKVLLEHSHTHLFTYCYGYFHTTRAELGSCDRHSLKNLLSGSLRKSGGWWGNEIEGACLGGLDLEENPPWTV
jgi:hypothetical protein